MRKFWPNSAGRLVVAGLSAFSSGCLFQKHPHAVFSPPPPRAQPQVAPAAPPQLPPPPQIATDLSTNVPPEIATSIPDLEAPPAPRQPPRRPPTPTAPKPAASAPTEQAPPPRLGQIFTPEQEREYNRTIDESLDRVKKALAILSKKNLNADQADAANRITNFEKQAEQARDAHDLANADLWAKRARELADDLVTRVP